MAVTYTFESQLWRYPEQAGWHFITLPESIAAEIRDDAAPLRRGFGSIKVTASILDNRWSTSIFPDSTSGSYLLPVKKSIRDTAGIQEGDTVQVLLEVPGLD